ncbi:MAG: SLBB domain-containing protein [Planctomycetota bacterium]
MLLPACRFGGYADAPPTTSRPLWVDTLREDVAPVEHLPPSGTVEQTGWDWGGTSLEDLPRGAPRDLAKRLAGPPAPPKKGSSSSKSGGASGRADATAGVGITLADLAPFLMAPQAELEEKVAPPAPPPLSPLERLYRGSFGRDASRDVKQVGYDYFAQPVELATSGPVPDGYALGPGDEVILSLSGTLNEYHRLDVDANGELVIPELGSVHVAGIEFGALHDVLSAMIARTRRGFELTVSMGTVRTIRVHVVGEVRSPGLVDVSARSTLLEALSACGGPAKTGSLRRIVHRAGDEERQLDLYDFLHGGGDVAQVFMSDGDTIVVPPIGATIGIAGYAQRPGIYELLGPATLSDALELAGGLTPFTFTPQVQIERTIQGRGRETLDVELNEEGLASALSNGDLVLIGAVDSRHQPLVQIEGEVVRPGSYQFLPGMTLRDLVQTADGLTIEADLSQALVSRQVGTNEAMQIAPERAVYESARRVLVVDLAQALAGVEEENPELMPLDLITIRSRSKASVRPTVRILGPVRQPGTYELTPGLRISDVIAIAGNLQADAFYDEAELIRNVLNASGDAMEVMRFRIDLRLALEGDPEHNAVLSNGDQIVVRSLRNSWVTVTVDGEVKFPGTYVFAGDAKIDDLIAAAGGVLPHADLRAASFRRQSVREMQLARFRHLAETMRRRFEYELQRGVQRGRPQEGLAARLALQQIEELSARMAQSDGNGRIVLPFLRVDFPDSPHNLTLEDGDRLSIPRHQETVAVLGNVFNPSTFVAEPGLTVEDVLERCGGLTEYADDERIYVMRADGQVEALHQKTRRLRLRALLLGGDVVLVPRAPIERSFLDRFNELMAAVRLSGENALLFNNLGSELAFTWVSNYDRNDGITYGEGILEE